MAEAERIKATGESASRTGRDPVNQPMVNNWVEAMGDRNPVYVDPAAASEVATGHPCDATDASRRRRGSAGKPGSRSLASSSRSWAISPAPEPLRPARHRSPPARGTWSASPWTRTARFG